MKAIKDDTLTYGTLLVAPNARVTGSIAELGGVTYPIHSISSIRIVKQKPKIDRTASAVLAVFAALIAIKYPAMWIAAIICAALAAFASSPKYVLILATMGQEHAVMESTDGEYLNVIKGAIETAIEQQSSPPSPDMPHPAMRLVPG